MPLFHDHVFGYIVRRMRDMRANGASPNEILQYVRARCGQNDSLQYEYLNQAFLQGHRGNIFFFTIPPFSALAPAGEEASAKLMDERKAEWTAALFPELPRLRDYFSFLEFARDERLIIAVCGAGAVNEPYRLHGVYDSESGEAAWSAKRGEHLRVALNRRLGAELVRFGPHDDWEHRNDPQIAGPLWGPQAPTIQFNPDGEIMNYLRWQDMARSWPYARHWSRLYPHHEVDA
jgi:hypothetical protein